MSSLQFEFLDLSEIEDEELRQLECILDEKEVEFTSPPSEISLLEDLKEVGEDFEDLQVQDDPGEEDLNLSPEKDESVSGISFFVDGGTAEDIDPGKPPPMLRSEDSPPPTEELSSPPCEEQQEVSTPEESMNMYSQHTPQPQYINQPPPPMVQPMNIHSVPHSGQIYNLPPPYPPHSTPPGAVPNGMYSHIPPNHSHPPHLVHIENCHVNLTPPFGNPQPHTGMYSHQASHYQGTQPQHQVYPSHYMVPDQPPMSMQMKPNMEKDYELKRHEAHNRGNYRGRGGRGRGTRRKGRDDHERSNSVSSDHSSYSDSGSKPHYKESVPPMTMPSNAYLPMLHHYPPFMVPYAVGHVNRPQHGYPMMPPQFMPEHHYINQHQPTPVMAAYPPPPPPPPASVALMSNENTNHVTPHSECDSNNLSNIPNPVQEHITVEQQQVTSITTHSNYIVTTVNSPQVDTCQYSYSNIDESCIMTESSSDNVCEASNSGHSNSLQSSPVINSVPSSSIQFKEESFDKKSSTLEKKQTVIVDSLEKEVSNAKVEFQEEHDPVPSQKIQFKVIENSNFSSGIDNGLEKECVNPVSHNKLPEKTSQDVIIPSVNKQDVEKETAINDNQASKARVKVPTPKGQESVKKPPQVVKVVKSQVTPSSNPSVINNKISPVPSNTQKTKDGLSTQPKSKRKSSPHNKEKETSSFSPSLSQSKNSPPITFGSHDSLTVYNKSLIITNSNELQNSAQPETKPKPKIENNFIASYPKTEAPVSVKAEKKSSSPVVPPEEVVAPEVSLPVVKPPTEEPKPIFSESTSSSFGSEKQSGEAAWGQKKSWSQLFKPNEDFANKQVAFVSPFNAKEASDSDCSKLSLGKENGDISFADGEADKAKVGGQLKKYNADYRPVLLRPRGLINKNYWCYVNAPLQALLACPSLYQLAKTLSTEAGYMSGNVSTPFINSIVDFVSEFSAMPPAGKSNRKEKGGIPKKDPEVVTGSPFEPTCVYKMLINCKENQFTEGRQQDAEEMLSCVLNGLHDEMVESLKLAGASFQNGFTTGDKTTASDHDLSEDENEWKVQGPKKKSCITRTAHFHPSPISQIFWGQLRSVLQQAGGSTTANLQPFNTLPLDIQSAKVDTLKDALSQLVTREEISGFTCPKTNQEVTASNQVMFEDLPRVLILQLKRFIYDKDGGLQKVTKRLQFPIDLEITKDLISANSRGRFSWAQRKYKLFAIVNHEGKEATKGHYVADVYHNGYNCWLRYDDGNVKSIPEGVVLRHEPPRVPYLLFYRRSDTLTSPPCSSSSSSSSSSSGSGSSTSKNSK